MYSVFASTVCFGFVVSSIIPLAGLYFFFGFATGVRTEGLKKFEEKVLIGFRKYFGGVLRRGLGSETFSFIFRRCLSLLFFIRGSNFYSLAY